jgi:hypothetical protein
MIKAVQSLMNAPEPTNICTLGITWERMLHLGFWGLFYNE